MRYRVEPAAHLERGMGRCRLPAALLARLAPLPEALDGSPLRITLPDGHHTVLCRAWPLPPSFPPSDAVLQIDTLVVAHDLGPRHVCSEACLPDSLTEDCLAVVPASHVAEAATLCVSLEAATLDSIEGRDSLPDAHSIGIALAQVCLQQGATITSPFLRQGVSALTVVDVAEVSSQGPSSHASALRTPDSSSGTLSQPIFTVTQRTHISIAPVRSENVFLPQNSLSTSSSSSSSSTSTSTPAALQAQQPLGGVAGLDDVYAALSSMVRYPLMFPEAFAHLGLECPKGVLLYGPPGTGKTQLVMAVAAECAATLISVRGPDIFAPYLGESESNLRRIFGEATQISQARKACILFIDEIDALCPHRQDGQVHEARVVAQLLTLMDGLASRGKLVVIAATNRPNSLDPALRRPGRFDREISVGIPSKAQRLAILQLHTRSMPLSPDVDLHALSDETLGYVGADLVALCREASMFALRAFRKSRVQTQEPLGQHPIHPKDSGTPHAVQLPSTTGHKGCSAPVVGEDAFRHALTVVVPSTRREAELSFEQSSWDDIGGLEDVKENLRQAIEWPFVYADTFSRLGLTAPKGVLLYGPPGCSKTTLVRAAASSCRATFWSINGAQIYSQFVGDSEKAIRSLFKRARQTAPSVIFLDEVDALVGSRSQEMSGNGVSERVLSTVLNEMDGVESAGQVLVVAATNRPDMLDSAFLRPGRIDRIVYVPPPDLPARREILRVKTKGMPVASDVDFDDLASRTHLYTGADLENLCREAALTALRGNLASLDVSRAHFETALKNSKPSLTLEQIDFYANLHVNRAK